RRGRARPHREDLPQRVPGRGHAIAGRDHRARGEGRRAAARVPRIHEPECDGVYVHALQDAGIGESRFQADVHAAVAAQGSGPRPRCRQALWRATAARGSHSRPGRCIGRARCDRGGLRDVAGGAGRKVRARIEAGKRAGGRWPVSRQRRTTMRRWRQIGIALCVFGATLAHGQGFPNKPVKIVVPLTAGSATDILARTFGQKLGELWGQPVVIDNRPGAGGTIGAALVAKSPADGYTLLVHSAAQAVNASIYPSLPYDTAKDFVEVATLGGQPNVLVVAPATGYRSVA